MEAGCYLDKRFRIHCNSNMTPRLSMNGINLEVLNISVDEGTIHVKFPIFYSSNCRGKESNPVIVNLEGSPFVYSEKWNRFVVVDCNIIVLMTQNDSARNHASCNGINCCQMRIPSHLMSFNAVFKDLDGGQGRGRDQCKHAYLVEQRWFHDRLNSSLETPYSVTDMDSVPVVLDWMIDYWIFESLERNGSLADNKTYHCHVNNYENISSNQKSMVKCSCSAGYHGNPYLPAGCPDINEFEDPRFNDCWKNMVCVNFYAGYGCFPPEVKKSPVKIVVVGICAALGVLFLLYEVAKKSKEE